MRAHRHPVHSTHQAYACSQPCALAGHQLQLLQAARSGGGKPKGRNSPISQRRCAGSSSAAGMHTCSGSGAMRSTSVGRRDAWDSTETTVEWREEHQSSADKMGGRPCQDNARFRSVPAVLRAGCGGRGCILIANLRHVRERECRDGHFCLRGQGVVVLSRHRSKCVASIFSVIGESQAGLCSQRTCTKQCKSDDAFAGAERRVQV